MAKSNFNFSATLKLNSKEFQRGVRNIQNTLNGLKNSFLSFAGALGAGLGLSQLISNIKSTATELSVAMNTLKNVSNVTKNTGIKDLTIEVSNYGEMLEYVRGVSNRYGQDLVAVTENFAQFHAACNKTNLSLEDQKNVFEALTRAAAAYHMSASRAKDMMNAVTQMMSKGKVAAEELRRQLGNSLPGAFNLMAAAMGISTQELDKLMRDGKVIAADVLPKFAAMLNQVTKNAEFDSLQLSMNKLKNAWYNLVNSSGAENAIKKTIDAATQSLGFLERHLMDIKNIIIGIGAALVAKLSVNGVKSIKAGADRVKKEWQDAYNTIEKSAEKAYKKIEKYNLKTSKTRGNRPYTAAGSTKYYSGLGQDKGLYDLYQKALAGESYAYNDIIKQAKEYNNQLLKQNELTKKLTGKGFLTSSDIKNIKEANKQFQEIPTAIESSTKAAGRLNRAIGTIGATLKSIGIMALIEAVLFVITTLVGRIVDFKKEIKEIEGITGKYQDQLKQINEGVQSDANLLRSQYKIVADTKQSESTRLANLKKINQTLGLTGDNQLKLNDLTKKTTIELNGVAKAYDKIEAAVEKWIDATVLQTKIQAQANAQAQAQARIVELQTKISGAKDRLTEKGKYKEEYDNNGNLISAGVNRNAWDAALNTKDNQDYKTITNGQREIEQLKKVIAATDEELVKLGVTLSELYETGTSVNTEVEAGSPTDILNDYIAEEKKIQNQYKNGAISAAEYGEELSKLTTETFKKLSSFGDWDKLIKGLSKGNQTLANTIKEEANMYNGLDDIEKTIKSNEEILERALNQEIEDVHKEFIKYINLMSSIDEQRLKDAQQIDGKYDYKYSNKKQKDQTFTELEIEKLKAGLDITLENVSGWENIAAQISNAISDGDLGEFKDSAIGYLNQIIEKIKEAKAEAITVQHAINLSEIETDIIDLKKELAEGSWEVFTDIANGADNLTNAVKNLRDNLTNPETTGWEKMLSIINTIIQAVEVFKGIIQAITIAQNISSALAVKSGAKIAAVEAIKMGILKEEAAAAASVNAMLVPYPANIAALTSNMTAIGAAFAAVKAFKDGGIVGGNSYTGDKVLTRVNSGEMILNKNQQSTLFDAIKSGNLGSGSISGNVQFKIRGGDLIGAIENYKSMKKG